MRTDPYFNYHKEVKQIEDTKTRLVWDLMSLEQHLGDSHDSQACQTLLKIATDLEDVVRVIKSNKGISTIPEVATELRIINDFTQKLETITRGRSWFSICREFEPMDSLDNIKELRSILKRSGKKTVNRRTRVADRGDGGGGLVDNDDWKEYINRPNRRADEAYRSDQELKDRVNRLRDRVDHWKSTNKVLSKDLDTKSLFSKHPWK